MFRDPHPSLHACADSIGAALGDSGSLRKVARRRPAVATPSILPLVRKRETWRKSLKLSSFCPVPESLGPAAMAFSVPVFTSGDRWWDETAWITEKHIEPFHLAIYRFELCPILATYHCVPPAAEKEGGHSGRLRIGWDLEGSEKGGKGDRVCPLTGRS